MASRIKSQQSKHDQKVKKIAKKLEEEGWTVQADLPGHDQPDPIGKKKRIPDIVATKSGAERIYEVETKETMSSDKEQQSTFRRRAAQKPRTKFIIEEA